MNRDDAVPAQADDTALPESYSTFWDAVPIPDGPATDTPAPPPATQSADDAYAAFMASSEDGPSLKLHVERY